MKNKLLLSTALVGSMVIGDLALAQTSVTGNLAINYRAQENKTASTGSLNSTRGFGRETQVNITNKGKLNNGMDYAAGFSLEFDGNNRPNVAGAQGVAASLEANSISNENIYVNFISGSTTFHIGLDHIQNITTDVVPMVLPVMDNIAAGIGGKATNSIGANPKEAFGFGVIQAIPGTGLTASALYVPRNNDFGERDQAALSSCGTSSSNSAGFVTTNAVTTGCKNSAYEIGLVGRDAFGVKGLGFRAFSNKEDGHNPSFPDISGKHYGVSYSMAPFTFGIEQYKQNRTSTSATTAADQKSTQYGVTFAVAKDVTIGLVETKTDLSTASTLDEKITSAQIGYNLGPVAIAAAVSKVDNVGASTTAGSDSKEFQFRITTNF
jgi:hypothetical protein